MLTPHHLQIVCLFPACVKISVNRAFAVSQDVRHEHITCPGHAEELLCSALSCVRLSPEHSILAGKLLLDLASSTHMWLQVMLENEMILSMLRDVVAGLMFLHAAVPPIRHQCLRSSKVLLDSTCRGHLSDYHQDVVRSWHQISVMYLIRFNQQP